MIDRYKHGTASQVWSSRAKYDRWREIEIKVLAHRFGPDVAADAKRYPSPPLWQIEAAENELGHDFVAWLRVWTSRMPRELAGRVHLGLTSSDVVDTALGMTISEAGRQIERGVNRLFNALWSHGVEEIGTIRVGRTHGQPAEVSSWGLFAHNVAATLHEAGTAHRRARRDANRCMISGPVGTYSLVDPDVERAVANSLGMTPAGSTTQVVDRGAIARWAFSVVGILGVIERFATEVRLASSRGEVTEGAARSRVGSSSMPQKRNPVASEQLCGIARLARGYLGPLLEDVNLWGERDISHSSVERVALPDLTHLALYSLDAATSLVETLDVHRKVMRCDVNTHYVDLLKHWALCRAVEAGGDRTQLHEAIRRVGSVMELEEIAGEDIPAPEWFLRNVTPTIADWGLDKEARAMVE